MWITICIPHHFLADGIGGVRRHIGAHATTVLVQGGGSFMRGMLISLPLAILPGPPYGDRRRLARFGPLGAPPGLAVRSALITAAALANRSALTTAAAFAYAPIRRLLRLLPRALRRLFLRFGLLGAV